MGLQVRHVGLQPRERRAAGLQVAKAEVDVVVA